MDKIMELIITHGQGWLLGVAAVIAALAQYRKITRPKDHPAQTTINPADNLDNGSPVAPTAKRDKKWNRAVWKTLRMHAALFFVNGLCGAGLALITPTVTPRFVAFELWILFSLLTSWMSAHRDMDRLRERWRD